MQVIMFYMNDLLCSSTRPAIHLSRNMRKRLRNVKREVYSSVFCVTFFAFHTPFFAFRFSQHFMTGSAFTQKVKGFSGLFFHSINKTRNLHEVRKGYSECSAFCGVFRENIYKIPAKYKKCIIGLKKRNEFIHFEVLFQNIFLLPVCVVLISPCTSPLLSRN